MINRSATLLWMDLEMTGLDPIKDRILEVAVIASDWDFKEIASYEGIVKVEPSLVERRMNTKKAFWDANPEARDGLVAQNMTKGRPGGIIENELLTFVEKHFDRNERIILAGNSIHQDRKFIDNEWPRLSKKLHHRMLDVSAWKVVFGGKFGKKFAKRGSHRALDDIRGSIEELEYYLKKVKAQ